MERPSLSTVQVVRQHARHLIQHLPDGLDGTLVPDFSDPDFGALLSLAQYDGQGSVGRFGLFQGVSIQGRREQLGPFALVPRAPQAHRWLLGARSDLAGG